MGDVMNNAIARLKSNNPTLTTLDLFSNYIWAAGAIAIADALRENTTLTTLDLVYNNIGDAGASAIADALRTNRALTTLYLYSNNIGAVGTSAIEGALRENGSITNFEPESAATKKIVARNKRAHARARDAVYALLMTGGFRVPRVHGYGVVDQEMSNIVSGIPKGVFRTTAEYLWSTRSESIWWLPSEGGSYGEEETRPSKRRALGLCIGCEQGVAKWMESSDSSKRFCGSYCQWIHRTGFPDLRGMTPAQVRKVLVY